jgi:glycosyltransferase involved in cell wall biosynthesis
VKDSSVIAFIPAWNEGNRISPVIEATVARLPVLVVDDGSHDDTVSIAEDAGATVVCHQRNRGKGVALTTGFKWALEHGYDAVLTLDADGQHDPTEIPKFLEAYQTGADDLIIGRRSFRKMPFPRFLTTPLGTLLLSLALGQWIYDNQSGYRLYTRRCLEAFEPTTTGFELEVEVIIQMVCKGMRIGWVDISTIYGINKVSYFHPVKDTLRFLGMVWHAWRQRRKCRVS